ncbi:transport between ER and Golgi ATPase protein [Terramyces sp. JEL0728]|nr:transport between ER and Golgi ATPase protein [Terramyces sp. JEL0728]
MKVIKCPDETLARTNLVFLNPTDIHPNVRYIIVDDLHAFSIGVDSKVSPGCLGTSALQRKLAGLSLNQDVRIKPFEPPKELFIARLILQVSFLRKSTVTTEPFDTDQLSGLFIKWFNTQVMTIGQSILMEFKGIDLLLEVTNIDLVDLGSKQAISGPKRGILMEKAGIRFTKDGDYPIKFTGTEANSVAKEIIKPNFNFSELGIGGLDDEFSNIFRRAFVSRIFPPSIVEKMGIQHVKGILLYGPPGTGKTLMARQIGKMLNSREPLIVNGPEVLNKFVGQSEENVRKLFAPAEAEYKAKGEESGLHIIIFDELDAICKQRGSKNDGTGTGDSIVNQLLSKMDGVDQLNNILIIGMTNRMDMIDEALLRPGRLEIHMEINLPDENGRVQILNVHTQKMRKYELLEADVDLKEIAALTKNFSGAEIAGLIKSASSFAFNRHVKIGDNAQVAQDFDKIKIARSDFIHALEEVRPAFGVAETELQQCVANGIIKFHYSIERILNDGQLYVDQVRNSSRTPLVSVLLYGPVGSGKTALASTIAMSSEFPFIKLISPESMVGFTEQAKMGAISKVFNDAYKSPLSVVVIDSIERLLDWVSIGPRFSNVVLQTLLVLLKKPPPKGHKLLILATTSQKSILEQMELIDAFNSSIYVPNVTAVSSIETVLKELASFTDVQRQDTVRAITNSDFGNKISIGIKKLIYMIEMAAQDTDKVEKLTITIEEESRK